METIHLTSQDDAASLLADDKQAWIDWMLQAVRPLPRHLWLEFTWMLLDLWLNMVTG